MKQVLILIFINIFFIGCIKAVTFDKNKIPDLNSRIINSETIVSFKKDITLEEAQTVVNKYNMKILKIYKRISKSTRRVTLHISSCIPLQKMINILKQNSKVYSVSPDYTRKVKN